MAVLAYIEECGMVLLIKRGTPPYFGFWSLPGGGTGEGEDPREACIREVKEETGLDIEILEEVHRVRGSLSHRASVFSCRRLAGEPRPHPPETLSTSWFPLEQAARQQLPPFIKKFLVERVRRGEDHI